MIRLLALTLLVGTTALAQPPADPYLHALYDRLHASPTQEKFKALAPMPAGVVYVQQPGEGEAEMRRHFQTMKRLGFNALKQILPRPDWTIERIALVALDEGIVPWWYGEGGYEPVTDDLLRKLKLPATLTRAERLAHPAVLAHQREVLRKRILAQQDFAKKSPTGQFMRSTSVAYDPEIGGRGLELNERGEALFVDWLKKTYGTVEALNDAWNQHHAGLFLQEKRVFRDWADVAQNWRNVTHREYRHVRDVLRFKVEHNLARIREAASRFREFDPDAPYRGGGEIGLFNPIAWYGVDMAGIADVLTDFGSFYPSMHFSWHFGPVDYELGRTFYMQASLMADLFKGGWTGGWESTGGPQQLDGERNSTDGNAYTVEAGELMQLYLSQLAAGFRGFGIWCWNARSAGKEGGEYALLDRNGQVTDRAVAIGKLAQAMQRYRFELWNARKEPTVGVLYDWENEALWAAMSIPGRDYFKNVPVQARVGISRVLANANVPYEYVTPEDLKNGLAPRYRVLYLPAMHGLRNELLPLLKTYAEAGGRLVLDLPGAGFDELARVRRTGKGSPFEQLFGATLDDFQYAGTNRAVRLEGDTLRGFTMRATPTTARILARYDGGQPAVLENSLGRGRAVLLGYEAALGCAKPGHAGREARLLGYALGGIRPSFRCEGAVAYRLASPEADHYFFLNDGGNRTVRFSADRPYRAWTDAITGESLAVGQPIRVEGHSGRWVRMEKRTKD